MKEHRHLRTFAKLVLFYFDKDHKIDVLDFVLSTFNEIFKYRGDIEVVAKVLGEKYNLQPKPGSRELMEHYVGLAVEKTNFHSTETCMPAGKS